MGAGGRGSGGSVSSSGGTTGTGGVPGSGGEARPGGRAGTGGKGTGGSPVVGVGGTPASGPTGGTTGSGTCGGGTAQSSDITINESSLQQKITGFGVSSAWAGSYANASDPDYLWSTTTGAGLTLLRIRYGDGLAIAQAAAK